jgi:hypothetical protein
MATFCRVAQFVKPGEKNMCPTNLWQNLARPPTGEGSGMPLSNLNRPWLRENIPLAGISAPSSSLMTANPA